MTRKFLFLCFAYLLISQLTIAQATYRLLGKTVTLNGVVTFDGKSSGEGGTLYKMYLDFNPETMTFDFADVSTFGTTPGTEYKRYWIPLADVDSEYFSKLDNALSDGYDLYNKSYWNIAFHAKDGKKFKYIEEGDYFSKGSTEGADDITFVVFEDKDKAIEFHGLVVKMFKELK